MSKDDWTEEQNYYEYSRTGWSNKDMPSIDQALIEAISEIGEPTPDGRPRHRFNWRGCALLREHPDGPVVRVDGNEEAAFWQFGRFQPRTLAGNAQVPRVFEYVFKPGGEVYQCYVPNLIPKTALMVTPRFYYVDFGQLRWHAETFVPAESLVAGGYYRNLDPNLPKEGDYISRLGITTTKGRYLKLTNDVGEVVLDMLRSTEARNAAMPLAEILAEDRKFQLAHRAEVAAAEAAEATAEWDLVKGDVEREVIAGAVIFDYGRNANVGQ